METIFVMEICRLGSNIYTVVLSLYVFRRFLQQNTDLHTTYSVLWWQENRRHLINLMWKIKYKFVFERETLSQSYFLFFYTVWWEWNNDSNHGNKQKMWWQSNSSIWGKAV